jgi:hypothetical protein
MTVLGKILYLHGLGSGPRSRKAELIREHFTRRGFEVSLPSITLPSLSELSPRAAVLFVRDEVIARLDSSPVIIGSSFGAFVAMHALAGLSEDQRSRIGKLVLIAPVFDPWDEHGELLNAERQRLWEVRGALPILDLERGVEVPVHYRFVEELRTISSGSISYRVPTLIVHGRRDEVVPCAQSEEFARTRPWVRLELFDDDHLLLADPEALLKVVEGFILSKSSKSR